MNTLDEKLDYFTGFMQDLKPLLDTQTQTLEDLAYTSSAATTYDQQGYQIKDSIAVAVCDVFYFNPADFIADDD